ncbi:MAG: NPCBM/NEW2 domain-containing protein [Pseudolysinimonas sp.]
MLVAAALLTAPSPSAHAYPVTNTLHVDAGPEMPEPPGGQLSETDVLAYTSDVSGASPCLTPGISLTRFTELGCRATSLSAPTVPGEPIPPNLVPETVVTSLTPNCSPQPDLKPTVQLMHGSWVGATSTVATATTTMNQETNGGSFAFSRIVAPQGTGTTTTEAYEHATTTGSSDTKEVSSQLAKTYVFNVSNTAPIPPYSWMYYTFKPSYTRHDFLWTWNRPGPSDRAFPLQDSFVDSVVTVDVTSSGTLRGKTEAVAVPMTPAEIRACQLGRTAQDAPTLRDFVLGGPSNVGKLSQFPFYSLATTAAAPVLRNISAFTVKGDLFGSDDGQLVARKPRIQTGWSADLDHLPLGQRSTEVSESLTMAAPTQVGFWLGGQCTAFTAKVGYDAYGRSPAQPDTFSVFGAHPFNGQLVVDKEPLAKVVLPGAPSGTDLDPSHFAIDLDVPIPAGTKVLVLKATRADGMPTDPNVAATRDYNGNVVTSPADVLASPSRIVVATPEVHCTQVQPIAGAEHIVRSNTNKIVDAEVNLAPTQEQARVNSKYFGVPQLDYNYYDAYNPGAACQSHKLDANAAGRSCSGGPIVYRGQVYTTGIGIHAPVNSVRWSNTGQEDNPYLASCSAFSFKIAYAYYPAPYRPDHRVSVIIDGKTVQSFLLPANAEGDLQEHRYTFSDYGYGYGPHAISLQVLNADPNSSINYDSHVNIIEPKLICRDQRASFETVSAPKAGDSAPANAPDPVPSTESDTFISDMPFLDEQNGYGPVERDSNIGGQAAHDGTGPVAIAGTSYRKGLGMHSDGQLSVDLAGRCSTFTADVGIDDDAGDNGSVTFRVIGDGTLLTETGVIRGTAAALSLSVKVSGVKKLTLQVTHAGDNWDWDQAWWGGARVTCSE